MYSEPDTLEKIIRFICGVIFGLLISVNLVGYIIVFESTYISVLIIFAVSFVCGFLAMKKGDSFWESIKNWLF